jgi:hypothetical protein
MARLAVEQSALHVAWRIASADAASARVLRNCLKAGHDQRLFFLLSLDFGDGEAIAILLPTAPLEEIAAIIWSAGLQPVGLSLVEKPQLLFRERLRRRA